MNKIKICSYVNAANVEPDIEAAWIWLDPALHPEKQQINCSRFDMNLYFSGMALFRRDFEIARQDSYIARISGDCKYRLKINGAYVFDGPPEVGGDYANTQAPDWWFYDTVDLSEFLTVGQNRIEAEVLMQPQCETDYSTGQGGFLFELKNRAGQTILSSDESWLCCHSPAWKPDQYDASLEPEESQWSPAKEIEGTRWNLYKLEIPHLRIEEINPQTDFSFPVTVNPGVPQVLRLSFEQELSAILEMRLVGKSGASILIEYGEHKDVFHHSEFYKLKDGEQYYRSTRMNAFQHVKITVSCGIFTSNNYSPVTISEITALSRGFPVDTVETVTSDEDLNQVRECCARTMKLCMQRLHLDSPVHQEGLGCTGDYMIESLMSYYLFGEYRLAAADIRRTALLLRQKKGVMFHTSYSLMFIEMVRDYFYYSGDLKLVGDVLPEIAGLLELFTTYLGPTGIVSEAPNYMFADWVNDGDYNYHHPPASRGMGMMSTWYYRALCSGAELADFCKENSLAENLRDKAEKLKSSFNRELWDEEKQLYRDGVPGLSSKKEVLSFLPAEDGSVTYSMHTNILVLGLSLAPEDICDSLMERVMKHDWPIKPQPYFMHFVFDALYRNNAFDKYAPQLLALWTPLVAEHPSSLKECWNCGDYSHAWGGTPAYQIGRSILGVTPAKPGFAEIKIAPHPTGLDSASGTVPTPLGPVKIKWQKKEDEYELVACLPEGMNYKLALPESFRAKEENIRISHA